MLNTLGDVLVEDAANQIAKASSILTSRLQRNAAATAAEISL
jgi:hypothetical protein